MIKVRKKPVVVSAIRLIDENMDELLELTQMIPFELVCHAGDNPTIRHAFIETLEGRMRVNEGDWIIRDVKGEYYGCDNDAFNMTYDILDM